MDRLVHRLWPKNGLIGILVGASLAIALPGHTGSVPAGITSGVTTGGSTLLPTGASTLGGGGETGAEVTLTAAAQQSLNESATQVTQGLQGTNPVLAAALTTPAGIALDSPSPVGATGETNADTPGQVASDAAAAIANGESVSLTSSQGTLGIAAPTVTAAAAPAVLVASLEGMALAQASEPPDLMLATSAVFIPQGGTPMVMPLQGTRAQIANAAGFLAAAFAAGITPNQVAPFTEMALVGADYTALVPLFDATAGLLLPQPSSTVVTVDPTQLAAAIQAYNRILNDSDAETLVALGQNADFVVLGRSLQQLRAAVNL